MEAGLQCKKVDKMRRLLWCWHDLLLFAAFVELALQVDSISIALSIPHCQLLTWFILLADAGSEASNSVQSFLIQESEIKYKLELCINTLNTLGNGMSFW